MPVNPLTDRQKTTLTRVLRATLAERWYRADGSGERVTLASLYRKGLLCRIAWRGSDGDADAAYEYQASPELLHELRELVQS